jgi:hypothetical protein
VKADDNLLDNDDFLDDDDDVALAHFHVISRRRTRLAENEPNNTVAVTKQFIILNELDENVLFSDAIRSMLF